jgi:uncharacterized protein (DUF433 family)
MENAMEHPDPLAVRDLLVGERKSSDVLLEAITEALRSGMTPAAILAECPTLSEQQVRRAIEALPN